MAKAPALFIGHGSPMNTLELNGYTEQWRALGRRLPRPRAILCISAHWFIGATAVTAMAKPRTIHDFYGFPQQLFDFQYPADGAPDVAQEVADEVNPEWVGLDRDQWGLDHGAWSVLAHLYPEADIPVVQLSINALKPLEYHVELGAMLAGLRDKGIMIVGSGNVVHNLRRIQWDQPDTGFDWAQRFDDAAAEQMAIDPGAILGLTGHSDYAKAVPTPDHFIPLLYIAGLAAAGEGAEPLLRGYAMGSLSMTCYGVSAGPAAEVDGDGAAGLPEGVPADQTNI
ncbi:MAG TPA: 4,5-DOPA dioxygenase extradiol [Sphingomicrobium sp.]|nr:4,5-DOPA dioxygenase extradiol [Sphingomicrobium sp.]